MCSGLGQVGQYCYSRRSYGSTRCPLVVCRVIMVNIVVISVQCNYSQCSYNKCNSTLFLILAVQSKLLKLPFKLDSGTKQCRLLNYKTRVQPKGKVTYQEYYVTSTPRYCHVTTEHHACLNNITIWFLLGCTLICFNCPIKIKQGHICSRLNHQSKRNPYVLLNVRLLVQETEPCRGKPIDEHSDYVKFILMDKKYFIFSRNHINSVVSIFEGIITTLLSIMRKYWNIR